MWLSAIQRQKITLQPVWLFSDSPFGLSSYLIESIVQWNLTKVANVLSYVPFHETFILNGTHWAFHSINLKEEKNTVQAAVLLFILSHLFVAITQIRYFDLWITLPQYNLPLRWLSLCTCMIWEILIINTGCSQVVDVTQFNPVDDL